MPNEDIAFLPPSNIESEQPSSARQVVWKGMKMELDDISDEEVASQFRTRRLPRPTPDESTAAAKVALQAGPMSPLRRRLSACRPSKRDSPPAQQDDRQHFRNDLLSGRCPELPVGRFTCALDSGSAAAAASPSFSPRGSPNFRRSRERDRLRKNPSPETTDFHSRRQRPWNVGKNSRNRSSPPARNASPRQQSRLFTEESDRAKRASVPPGNILSGLTTATLAAVIIKITIAIDRPHSEDNCTITGITNLIAMLNKGPIHSFANTTVASSASSPTSPYQRHVSSLRPHPSSPSRHVGRFGGMPSAAAAADGGDRFVARSSLPPSHAHRRRQASPHALVSSSSSSAAAVAASSHHGEPTALEGQWKQSHRRSHAAFDSSPPSGPECSTTEQHGCDFALFRLSVQSFLRFKNQLILTVVMEKLQDSDAVVH
ncbi:unnamed protein product [Schistocephalus solidus]|uniref:Uncharacterized protein n=1 Tax=Schistocephalus solidus TaxID=70667 RepID=A0A183T223_SCHSO|nr:unnamed protein product [Schistocephalus solidus]